MSFNGLIYDNDTVGWVYVLRTFKGSPISLIYMNAFPQNGFSGIPVHYWAPVAPLH
jgi:hypothetical protein